MKAQKSVYAIIARRYLQNRKTLLTSCVVAVIITCVLLVNLFTLIPSIQQGYKKSLFKFYGNAHGLYRNFPQKAIEFVQQSPHIQHIEYEYHLGDLKNTEIRSVPFSSHLKYMPESSFSTAVPDGLIEGRFPEAYNEVVMSTKLLDTLGIPHTIGATVPLSFTISSQSMIPEEKEEHFILTGYYTSTSYFKNTELALVSAKYKEQFSDLDGHFQVYFRSGKNLTKQAEALFNSIPYTYNNSRFLVNPGHTSGSFEALHPKMIVAGGSLLFFIFITAYLIINNLFTIFVYYDVHLYGQLKCLGASQKQIKKIIRVQLIYISAMGIPIGLVSGYFTGILALNLIGKLFNGIEGFIFNPWVYLGTALFAFLTLIISTRKPSIFCKSISPTLLVSHATHGNKRKISYKNKQKVTLWQMAKIESLSYKGRLVKIVLSLATTPILLLAILTFFESLDVNKYVKDLIASDFIIANNAYYRQTTLDEYDYTLDSSVIQELEDNITPSEIAKNYMTPSSKVSIQSVTGNISLVTPNSFQTTYQDKKFTVGLYGLEDFAISQYTVLDGILDKEKFHSGNYLLESVAYNQGSPQDIRFGVGEQVDLYFGDSFIGQYEIMAVVMQNYGFEIQRGLAHYMKNFVLPLSMYQSIEQTLKQPFSVSFNVSGNDYQSTQTYLEDFVLKYPDIYVQTPKKVAEFWKRDINNIIAMGLTLAILVGIIGLINMAGVVIVGIYSRKEQFINLRKIGMSKKQLLHLLLFESSLYAVITFIIFIGIGGVVVGFLLKIILTPMEIMTFQISIIPSLLVFIGYILSMAVVSWLALHSMFKQKQ